ncbi:MAG TPA: PQQ-binding-like beta-propeller repeat protein [Planctomycetota bacterium]|nr:PQQ-binding-like beta-propeller repeat protein [Planctomycetota bacterium]
MSLKGSLSSVNLTEIFQMLSLSGREGTLFIYDGPRKRAICFTREGVSIRSRERNESNLIGKILVRLGRIDESHLQSAVESRRSGDRLLGDTLVDMGACASADVDEALRLQSEEEIQELFLNRSDAQFEYVDGFFPETDIPYVSLNVNSLLIDIARRTDEWEYIRRRIRGPREIYRFTGAEGEVDGEVLRECYAPRVDPFIDGSNSIGDVIDVSYVNKFHVCKLMAAYLDAGIIELVPADAIRQNARLALRMGDSAAAIRHYEYLIGTGDFPLDILGEAAEAHEANRDFPEAAALLRRLAEELVRAGDYRGAIDVLRRVANYPRPEPEALRYLIDLVFENPRAAAEFAVNIVEAGKTLVSWYLTQDQPDEATALLERLLQIFPDEVAFALSLVDVHAEHGDVPQASAECERLASSYQKRRQVGHAVTLYKRLLALDPERQDIRDRLRKISSGRRRRVGPALPRVAVALGLSLLLGGVAVVWVKQQGVGSQSTEEPIGGAMQELLGRASEEKAGAVRAGGKAATIYAQLLEDLRSDAFAQREALLLRVRTADENFQEFRDLSDKARSIAEVIRRQTTSGEFLVRTKAMLDTLDGQSQRVETARRQYVVAAQKAAAALKADAETYYIQGKLLEALPRYELAKQLAVDPDWKDDPALQQKIDNIRTDMERVAAEMKKAKALEEVGDWTAARRIYLDLLKEYKDADIVADLLLPVEILTLPQGATILLDTVEYSRPTPTLVRLNPHRETKLELRRKSFRTEMRMLGPFSGEDADPANYTYIFPLLRTATWERPLREEFIESDPVAWGDRVAVATRSGRYHIFDATTGKTLANDRLDVDGVSAGLACNGKVLCIPGLDGHVFFRDARTGDSLGYTLNMTAAIHATPAVRGNVFYVVDLAGSVVAHDVSTGRNLWTQQTPTGVRAAPVIVGKGLLVLSTAGDVSYLDLAKGTPLMEPLRLEGSFACAPAVVDDDLLIFGAEEGALIALKPSTREIRWRKPIDELRIKRTPPVQGPEVYVSRRPGHLLAFDVNTGLQLYEYVQNPNAVRSAVYANRRIFFVHDKVLTCFGPRQDGYGLAWTFQAKGRILGGPVVRDNAVYIGDEQGNLYKLEATD